MEYGNWKKLIYEWIRSTKFISIASDSIEHTNIDQFYEEFRLKLTTTIKETTVSEFLRTHYDSFEFHLDDSKEISSLDYVYIYSLLLHFSCVKHPDQYFHKLCQMLDDTSQMCIAKFFNLLLVNDRFDRDTVRAAISAARPASLQLLSVDSPIKTPQHLLSPMTPRTTYLEDKRRENLSLKAQLDSERYERSVLEMMLKQTEQKVEKMGLNQRKYIEEIQSLKCELLSRDTENRSPNKNYFTDQKNHRLQKDLIDKEERIIQLQLTIDNLMDDKIVAGEKLALNEKQLLHWIDKSRALEQNMVDSRAELDDLSGKIKCLQETNAELLNFIRESRGGVQGLDSLNASSCEGLDFSFARSSDISSSSPENLGRTVIDIQLKEKEMENNVLRDKFELLKHDFNRIAIEIRNYCKTISDFEPLDPNESLDDFALPLKQFEMCKTYFADKLSISEGFIKNLSAENNILKEQINELGDVRDEMRAEIAKLEHEFAIKERTFDAKICELDELILTKTSENTDLFNRIDRQQINIEALSTQLDTTTNTKSRLENDIAESNDTIAELKLLCESRYAEIETIGCQNDLLRVENKDLVSAVAQLQSAIDEINSTNAMENNRLTSEIVELSRIVSSITDENSMAEEKIQQLTHKVFQSGEETRELRDQIGQLNQREDCLIVDHQNLMEKMAEVSAENLLLTQEITNLTESKTELTERFAKSIRDQQTIKSQVESHNKELTKVVAQAEEEKVMLKLEIQQMSTKHFEAVNHLKTEITDLTCKLEILNKSSLELTEKLTNSSAEKSALTEKLTKLEDASAYSETRISQILAEKSELTQQLSDSQFDLSELGADVDNLKLKLQTLSEINETVAKSNLEHAEAISKLEAEKHKLGAQIEHANVEIVRSSARIQELGEIINETSANNLELVSEKTDLFEQLAKLQAESQILDHTKETLAKSNSEHVVTITKLQEKSDILSAQLELANLEIGSSVARIQELNQAIDEISMKNSGLISEKAEITDKLNKLHIEFANSEILNAELKLQNQTLSQANESAGKSNSEYVESVSKLQKECCNLTAQLDQANVEIHTSVSRIEELSQLKNVNSQMQSQMTKEIERLKIMNEMANKEKIELAERLEAEIENLGQVNASAARTNSEYAQTISELQEQSRNLTVQLDKTNTEIGSSVARIHELSRIVEDASIEISTLKNAIDTAMKEKIELTENLAKSQIASEARIAELQLSIQSLTQNNDSASKSISEYIKNISKLEEGSQNLTSQIDQAKAEIASNVHRIQELKQLVDETSTKNSVLTKEKAELIKNFAKLQKDLAESETRNAGFVIEIQALSQNNSSVVKLNSEYADAILKLQEENNNLNIQLHKDTTEIATSVAQIKKLRQVIDDASNEISVLNIANDLITKEKIEIIDQISKYQTDCANLQLELQSLNEANEEATKSNSEFSYSISKLEEESQNLRVQLVQVNAEIDSSVTRNQELSKIVDESSMKIFELTSEKAKLTEKLDKLEANCTNSETRIAELTTEISKISIERDSITTKLEIQIFELLTHQGELEQKLRNSALEVQTLTQSNDSAAKSNSEFSYTISNLQEESQNLRVQLVQANAEIDGSVTRIQELSKIVDESALKIFELASEKTKLTEKLDKLETECTNSETRIAELTTEISKISIERDSITTKLEIQISELLTQQGELEQKLRNSALEVQTLTQSNDSAAKSKAEYAETVLKLEKSSEILTSEFISVKETNCRLAEEIDNYKTQIHELTESRINELAKYELLICELRKEKDELIQTIANLKEDNARLENSETQIQEATSANSELLGKIEQLAKEKSEIQTQLSQEVDKFKAENAKLSEEVKQTLQTNESQIQELSTKNSELSDEIAELCVNSEKFRDTNLRLTEEIFTSESKIKELSTENKCLGDKISELNAEIRIEQDRMLKRVEQLTREIDNLVQNYESVQKEKTDLDVELKIARTELSSLKDSHTDAHSIKLALIEKEQTINSLEYNLNKLQKDNIEKDKYIENLDQRVSQKEMEIADLMHKLEESDEKDKLLNREKSLNEKCTQDIAILKAKLYKHRELSVEREKQWNVEKEQLMAAIEEQKTAEERITENRLELVGKLEKMKTKMKTLYNEEMVKVKTKHENEISDFQKQAKEKFGKYDSHIEKLSKQIYQLNERNLGLEKENTFLRTKIDFLEINTDAAGSTMALNSMGSGGSRNLLQSTNLKMEDEEGEIFNNTYLTDLKTGGRISPTNGGLVGRDSVRFSELQHRNSLMPRHLRSTYAAQYGDQELCEDDLKDPINLDDSLNSLLYGGQRKKISGATTYKRPGPPTPSKNAGRLSFGAVTELQAREVLKENNSNIPSRLSMTGTGFGIGTGNKRNTPRKLKSLFSSSTSKIKDDFHSDPFDKSITARKSQLQQLMITSTPRRRSNVNRCRPRLSGHFGISKTTAQKLSARQLQMAASIQSAGSIQSGVQHFPIYQQQHGEWRQPGSIIDSESCTSTSQTGSDYEEQGDERNTTLKLSANTSRRRSSKFTVKTSALSHSRKRYRMKSKENRLENFNRARRSINNFILRKSLLNRISTVNDEDHPDFESDPYELLKDLVELSSQAVAAAKFNDGEAPSFAEFEKLAKFKVSEAPFDTTAPETADNKTVIKRSSLKKKSLYSGGVIINRKIPRLSIRIGGYHILNRGYSNDSSNRSFDHTMMADNQSSSVARNWSHACFLWRQYDRRVKSFGIGMAVILLILNLSVTPRRRISIFKTKSANNR